MKRILGGIVSLGCLVWLGIFAAGFLAAMWDDMQDYPGKKQFEAANQTISVYSNEVAFGNSPQAKDLAQKFNSDMAKTNALFFKGGSSFTPATMGHFLTYCRLDNSSVVFLCQVPDLRGYKADVRDDLAKLAWTMGMSELAEANLKNHKLVVGLRGFGSYGPIMEGPFAANPANSSMDDLNGKKRLYPYFIPDK